MRTRRSGPETSKLLGQTLYSRLDSKAVSPAHLIFWFRSAFPVT